jgi:hypothetical protein
MESFLVFVVALSLLRLSHPPPREYCPLGAELLSNCTSSLVAPCWKSSLLRHPNVFSIETGRHWSAWYEVSSAVVFSCFLVSIWLAAFRKYIEGDQRDWFFSFSRRSFWWGRTPENAKFHPSQFRRLDRSGFALREPRSSNNPRLTQESKIS